MGDIRVIFIALLLLFSTSKLLGQNVKPEADLIEMTYTSSYDRTSRNYYVYLPKGYNTDEDKKWPVMLFLHGNGERGNGKEELAFTLAHGPIYEAWIQKRDLPFIIIQPQLHMHGFDSVPDSYFNQRNLNAYTTLLIDSIPPRTMHYKADFKMEGTIESVDFPFDSFGPPMGWETVEYDLMGMLNTVHEKFSTNKSQVYLTGLSYGGFGTWLMASKYPQVFAAIAPIVGWGHPDLMTPIAKHKIPVWCFAGGRDKIIELEYFYKGLNELETLGHQNIRFTIEADMSHDVWKRVYAGEDIYQWFLNQKN